MKRKRVSTHTIVSQVEEIVSSDIEGETVMMSIENGKYYGMDAIGGRIWKLIEHPIKVSDLIDTLLERFHVDRETCERDVLKFLNELNDEKIIKVEG